MILASMFLITVILMNYLKRLLDSVKIKNSQQAKGPCNFLNDIACTSSLYEQ